MALPFNSDETKNEQVGNAPGQEQTPTTPPAGYVTIEEFNKTIKGMEDKLSNWYRGIQSQTDNIDTRVQKRIAEYEAAATLQGVKLTDSQKQQLTDQTTLDEIRASSSAQNTNANPDPMQRQGESDEMFANRVNDAADTLMKAAGITFEDSDPEVALINKAANDGSAEAYLQAHQEAIKLKKERLAGNTGQNRPPTGGVPGAMPGTPNSNPISNIMDKDQLWELAMKQGETK
jgi:hypothetical protein